MRFLNPLGIIMSLIRVIVYFQSFCAIPCNSGCVMGLLPMGLACLVCLAGAFHILQYTDPKQIYSRQ